MPDIITDLRAAGRNAATQGADALSNYITGRDRVMMMLGQFMFSMASATPQSVGRRDEYKWPAQDVIGKRPVLQNLGPGQTSFDLPGRLYPHYKGGLRQIEAMRELAGLGNTQLLVDALGFIYGDFVITDVEETQTTFDATEAPRRIDFRLRLAHAGDDEQESVVDR